MAEHNHTCITCEQIFETEDCGWDGDHPWGNCARCQAEADAEEAKFAEVARQRNYERAKGLYEKIVETLEADGVVTLATYCRATHYDKRHLGRFKLAKNGLFV